MNYYIVGLGNPGEEYLTSRHNAGRSVLERVREKNKFPEWEADKKLNARVSQGAFGKEEVTLMEPETFMNKSGASLKSIMTSKKKAEKLVVVHDDIDLPVGSFKISFNRGSGGHRGVESVIKQLKTEGFARVRVGVAPQTPSGKTKKPHGKEAIVKFILGNFTPAEMKKVLGVSEKISEALKVFVLEGRDKAMNMFN